MINFVNYFRKIYKCIYYFIIYKNIFIEFFICGEYCFRFLVYIKMFKKEDIMQRVDVYKEVVVCDKLDMIGIVKYYKKDLGYEIVFG